MSVLDWLIVVGYLAGSLAVGLIAARRGAKNIAEFFVGGRSVPWWLAAASMAAVTFNVDTPLYVVGQVARFGVAGNWQWWSFAFAHVLLAVVLAKLWRRAHLLTDLELTEIRYSGEPARYLRTIRAFLLSVPFNCLSIGYGMLAMRKVVVALGLLDSLPNLPGDPRLWALLPIVIITLIYTAATGLWGVVATDFFQYVLAMTGAMIVMVYAVHDVGGLHALTSTLRTQGNGHRLDLIPTGEGALVPITTFLGWLTIQWWTFRGSDGGGVFIQRLSSVRDEHEAEKAAKAFNVLNYVIRSWPWILVGLCTLVILPGLKDPELGYPMMMKRYLPTGVLGLVFASLVAAFMSSISSQVNWGASYLVNDIYARYSGRRDDFHLMRMARWASIGITLLAATVSFFMNSVGDVFTFLILVGNGPGLVLLLRWFWWRINAAAELAAMGAGILLAITTYIPGFPALNVGQRLLLTAFGSMAVWLPVMFLTRPEPAATLDAFYARVRPGGWWGPVQARTGLTPMDHLGRDLLRWLFWVVVILGGTVGIGALLLR